MTIYSDLFLLLLYWGILNFMQNISRSKSLGLRSQYRLLRWRVLWISFGLLATIGIMLVPDQYERNYTKIPIAILMTVITTIHFRRIKWEHQGIFGGRALLKGPDASWS